LFSQVSEGMFPITSIFEAVMDFRVSLSIRASCSLSAILQDIQEAAVNSLQPHSNGQGAGLKLA